MTKIHSLPIRVYYEDTDAGGVVYYANYLKFCERGRTELLRSLGYENKSLMDGEGMLFVVHRIEADYLEPARLDDSLSVLTTLTEIKNTSFTMKQTVERDGKMVFDMNVRLVCVNKNARPVRVPEDLKKALQGH